MFLFLFAHIFSLCSHVVPTPFTKYLPCGPHRCSPAQVVLSDEEMRIIQRLRHGKYPHAAFDPYEDFNTGFSAEKEIHPLGNVFAPKQRFIPSKHEGRKIYKLVNAIRNGWIKLDDDEPESEEAREAKKHAELYLIWSDDGQAADRNRLAPPPITAPKPKVTSRIESER
jgi:ribosome biogenesis protein ERB1